VISAIFRIPGVADGSVDVLRAETVSAQGTGVSVGAAVIRDGVARVDGLRVGSSYVALIATAQRSWAVRFPGVGRQRKPSRSAPRDGSARCLTAAGPAGAGAILRPWLPPS
jgi:hypothetical protein